MSTLPAGLMESLKLPVYGKISPALWVAATVLGRLRKSINDEFRARDRDRGRDKNDLADLQGALGELMGVGLIDRRKEFGVGQAVKGLIDLWEPVDSADLTVFFASREILIDVKCHFDDSVKQYFAVNERARERSVERGVSALLPIATAAWRENVVVGRPIPVGQLKGWKGPITLGGHRDECRTLPLEELYIQFLDERGFQELVWNLPPQIQWGERMLGENHIEHIKDSVDRPMLKRLRQEQFSLDGRSFDEIVEALVGILPQGLRRDLPLKRSG